MRLIDADAMKIAVNNAYESFQYECIEDYEFTIDNAPTIDAIPMEWLREFDMYYAGISGGSPYFRELIAAWQKEQEAR